MKSIPSLIQFTDIDLLDRENIGKEGEKIGALIQEKFPLPEGFIISATGYMQFLTENKLDKKITHLLTTLHYDYPETVIQIANHINKMIMEAPFSDEFYEALRTNYSKLHAKRISMRAFSHTKDFPLHTSQVAENFDEVLLRIKDVWAAHFSAYLLHKRNEQKVNQLKTGTTIIVQRVPQLSKQGKIITIDPIDHNKTKLLITHKTEMGTDSYVISKQNMNILERHFQNHRVDTRALTLGEIWAITRLGKRLEQHAYFPQEITWGIEEGKLLLINTRPYTQLPKGRKQKVKKHAIARGHAITRRVFTGTVKHIHKIEDLKTIKNTDIIVVKEILPDYLPYLSKIKGVVTEKGEKHSQISTSLRKQGVSVLYDVKFATKALRNGQIITIHGGNGEIYNGGML